MKKTIPLLTVMAVLALLGSTSQSSAQSSDAFSRSVGYRATGDDGITASPKWRQFLDERAAMNQTTSDAAPVDRTVGYRASGDDGITASPKMRQMLNEQYAQVYAQLNYPEVASRSVGYQATGDDGITASPKMRQMLNERGQGENQVASLK